MKLCLCTLACPTWTFQQIVDAAAQAGLGGIDFRGIASEIDITHSPQFTTDLPETMRVLSEKQLRLPCFNLSAALITPDADRWQEFVDETLRAARLARQTHTKFLRVFGGAIPKEMTRSQARALGREHLDQLCDIALEHDSLIVLETHDDWATSSQVLDLLDNIPPERVGVLWDFEHTIRRGESCYDAARAMAPYLKHVQVKDSYLDDGRVVATLLGEGDLPIDDVLAALKKINYAGWYSLETEKRWRADAPEPEESIPQFAAFMSSRLSPA
ncbi:MAG TPA: sugar phosphate isomerase/epimerase family protein [Tepidisphaeraceae bacterium]